MSETNFSPREIVSELDRNIVGQHDAKRLRGNGHGNEPKWDGRQQAKRDDDG